MNAFQLDLFPVSALDAPFGRPTEAKKTVMPPEQPPGLQGVIFKLNPRLRSSWRIEWKQGAPGAVLQLPLAFAEAPDSIREALVEWAIVVRNRGRRPKETVRRHRAQLEAVIRGYMDDVNKGLMGSPSQRLRAEAKARSRWQDFRTSLVANGRCHHLEDILARIAPLLPGPAPSLAITWAPFAGGLSYHRRLKSPDGSPCHLVSISRGYDFPNASVEMVGGVVYHECLHALIPPRIQGGRRVIHGREFRRQEKLYPWYREWVGWHREVLPLNVAWLKRRFGRGRIDAQEWHRLRWPAHCVPRRRFF